MRVDGGFEGFRGVPNLVVQICFKFCGIHWFHKFFKLCQSQQMLVAFAWGMSRGITPAMHLLSERADNLVIFSRMDAVDKACDAHDTLGAKSANDLPMMELPSGGRAPSVWVAAGATHESPDWGV